MINLSKVGSLWQSTPANLKDVQTKAFMYACDMQIAKLLEYTEKIKVWCAIQNIDEKYLDYLAAESRALFYDTALDVDAKQELIINSQYWYSKLGTKAVIEMALKEIHLESKIEEWFDYGGEPHHFRIKIDTTNSNLNYGSKEIKKAIESYKRLTAILDEILISYESKCNISIHYDNVLTISSQFYPRYNLEPLLFDGSATFDDGYSFAGYKTGQFVDLYPLRLQIQHCARAAPVASMTTQSKCQTAVKWNMDSSYSVISNITSGLDTNAVVDIQQDTVIAAETATVLEVGQDVAVKHGTELSSQIVSGVAVQPEIQSGTSMQSSVQVAVGVTAGLTTEHHLGYWDGAYLFDGSRAFDADIFYENL